ncbi:MAG: hypothetical protein WBB70_17185 [Desulfobacterales bacterium]|jgi:hypothetical protein
MESLTTLLESVSGLLKNKEEDNIALSLMIHNAKSNPEKANPSLLTLLEEIKKYPELSIFDGQMHVLGNSAVRVDYGFLVQWLIKRTSSVGAKIAIQNLKKYISTSKLPFLEITAIAGFNTNKACILGNGIKLMPWDELPISYEKDLIHEKFISGAPFHYPNSILLREKTIKRVLVHQDETDAHFEKDLFSELHDALLCISIVGPVSPYAIASWLQPPDWVVKIGSGYSLPFIEGRSTHREWPEDGCEQATELHEAFLSLSKSKKTILRLSMGRLNSAMRRYSPVDAAIDLGIALESIFLSDLNGDRGELTFKLKLRASKFLGRSLDEKKELFKIFGDLYVARSKAVHTGKLPDKIRNEPINSLLNIGFNHTARAIRLIILNGQPDWTNITLN